VEKVSRRASGVTDEETARHRHYTRGGRRADSTAR